MQLPLFQVIALFTALVAANMYPTAPVQSTVWDATKPQTIKWKGVPGGPPLNLTGKVEISLFTGGIQQQTFLTCLTCARYVSADQYNSTVKFDNTVGPNGHYYFLRFSAKDSLTEDIFSGRFTLKGMTGTFNSTVLAQLATLNSTATTGESEEPAASASRNATVALPTASITAAIGAANASSSINAQSTLMMNADQHSGAVFSAPYVTPLFVFLALVSSFSII